MYRGSGSPSWMCNKTWIPFVQPHIPELTLKLETFLLIAYATGEQFSLDWMGTTFGSNIQYLKYIHVPLPPNRLYWTAMFLELPRMDILHEFGRPPQFLLHTWKCDFERETARLDDEGMYEACMMLTELVDNMAVFSFFSCQFPPPSSFSFHSAQTCHMPNNAWIWLLHWSPCARTCWYLWHTHRHHWDLTLTWHFTTPQDVIFSIWRQVDDSQDLHKFATWLVFDCSWVFMSHFEVIKLSDLLN